jgi:hypothetical protein
LRQTALAASTKAPLEVAIDVWAGRAEAGLAAAGVDAWCSARVGGELLGSSEPGDVTDLERNDDGEHDTDAGEG